jgi:hypothetical protein
VTRRDEGRATHPRYAALHQHPPARGWGDPVYTDGDGRYYRPAPPEDPAPAGYVKLYVTLPRKDMGWYAAFPSPARVTLRSVADPEQTVDTTLDVVAIAGHERAGHVLVRSTDFY